ncbi:MAG: MFS transporter, partial [Micromonosporaceae bacterium]
MRFARFARRRPGDGPTTLQERRVALVLTMMFCALTSVFFPTTALASPTAIPASPTVPAAPQADCSFDDLQDPARRKKCLADLGPVPAAREQCIKAPTPTTPDSGMAGWFTEPPKPEKGYRGAYLKYGYAGYSHTTYDDPDCGQTTMYPEFAPEHKIANAELLVASGIIGASNALRERAWDPGPMWDWANPLVEKATTGIYQKVFTVFGAITLAVVGIYLIWRSRQADMNDSLTTAGWAVLVIVVVTAVVAWPVFSANLADGMLLQSLGAIHSAIGPADKSIPPDKCALRDKEACKDNRKPAVRASDTATEAILYQNWLRGALGSSDSDTARTYGPALYHAKAFTWDELRAIRPEASDSTKERQKKLATRNKIIEEKAELWKRTAEQIRKTDPEAYEHLQGQRGMERIGASFIALLAAVFFALFDIVTSVLILLGFLVFRWAVVAAPLIGTFAMLRPASTGLKRLGNAVVAAIFNIVIFGAGAAVYLFAVDLILSTASLAGWLQVLLIGLCGIAGWMLLRPYRRLTQLG